MNMTTPDWIIIGVIALSTVMSLWRGGTREIFSLISWVLAAYVGVRFAHPVAPLFASFIATPEFQFVAAFLLLLVLVLIIGALLGRLISSWITLAGLTAIDKLLGVIFGCVRGIFVLVILVLCAKYTELPKEPWWQASRLLPGLQRLADDLNQWVKEQGFDFKAQSEQLKHWIEGESEGPATPAVSAAEPAVAPVEAPKVIAP